MILAEGSVHGLPFCTGIKPADDEPGGGYEWMKKMGIRTYDLNKDQILDIVEKVEPEEGATSIMIIYEGQPAEINLSCLLILGLSDKKMGLQPMMDYGIMMGGRNFPDLMVTIITCAYML